MRYPALETVMTLLKVIAAIQLALGVVMFFMALRVGFLEALSILIGSVLTAVFTFAAAQIIAVVLDIEANTRRAADGVTGQVRATPAGT